MATKYPQYLLSATIAEKGDYTIPPETSEKAGSGRLSQQLGWNTETSTPIDDGGVAPRREDFNGFLYLFSQFLRWYQQGGLMNYSSSLDYEPGNEILLNGVKFRCLKENGPTSAVVVPGEDKTVWENQDQPSVLAGMVIPCYRCSLGGSDGRRLIAWGATDADERFVLCDGGDDGLGGTVPNLIDKFIKGSTVANNGGTGGSNEITLTEKQIPAHSHTITINSNGDHTHTRGTMNITGGFFGENASYGNYSAYGAFQSDLTTGNHGIGDSDWDNSHTVFDASKTWSGATSKNGAHTHTASCATTGSGATIDNQPAFFQLAYFIKLPE